MRSSSCSIAYPFEPSHQPVKPLSVERGPFSQRTRWLFADFHRQAILFEVVFVLESETWPWILGGITQPHSTSFTHLFLPIRIDCLSVSSSIYSIREKASVDTNLELSLFGSPSQKTIVDHWLTDLHHRLDLSTCWDLQNLPLKDQRRIFILFYDELPESF